MPIFEVSVTSATRRYSTRKDGPKTPLLPLNRHGHPRAQRQYAVPPPRIGLFIKILTQLRFLLGKSTEIYPLNCRVEVDSIRCTAPP